MINRILAVIVFLPVAIVLIALAVANRNAMPLTFDPFNPGNPPLTLEWPLFVYLFIALGIGMLLGSFATWWKQGRYRKLARETSREVKQLRAAETAKPATTAVALTSR